MCYYTLEMNSKLRTFNRKLQVFFFLIFIFISHIQAQRIYPETYDGDSIFALGKKAFENNEYEKAGSHFSAIFRSDPLYESARYERMLSLAYMDKGDVILKEMDSLYVAGEINSNADMLLLYGSYLSNDSNYVKALELFTKVEKMVPNSSVLLYNMGLLHYRMKSLQKSVDYLKLSITHNPNHISSHYILGLICLEEGKVAEGTLALLSCLLNQPQSAIARDIIAKLNVKMSLYYDNTPTITTSEVGDDFTELTTILQNQLALNPKYKLKASIDDIFTRQVQAVIEYADSHTMGDGFFEYMYIPWMKQIALRNQTEALIYFYLQEYRETLGKKLTSKDKMVAALNENYLENDIWYYFGKRKLMHFGKKEEVMIFLKDNFPSMIGKVVNNEYDGPFIKINKHGKKLGEFNYKKNQLQGLQKFYNIDGQLTSEAMYKDDMLNGIKITYYPNGLLQEEETYLNDELDGLNTTYHINGGINCKSTYVKGQIDGKFTCYHPDGSIRIETTFKSGKLDGSHKSYNEVGDMISDFNYIDDKLNGTCTEYYDGKIIKSVGTYHQGENSGPVSYYNTNGTIANETRYVANKMTEYLSYNIHGKLSNHRLYDDKSNLKSISYFDGNGDKYYEETYSNGNVKNAYQYTKGQAKPVEVKFKDDNYFFKSYHGMVTTQGQYSKGKMNGLWKYYHSNGKLYLEQTYANDVLKGTTKEYDYSGQLVRKNRNENSENHGIKEIFSNGKLTQISYFLHDNHTGPYISFYPDGSKNYEGYVINNSQYYTTKSYYRSGQLYSQTKYYDDKVMSQKLYNLDGSLNSDDNYGNLNGEVKSKTENGLLNVTNNFKNGMKHGLQRITDDSGKVLGEFNYINGNLHGPAKSYNSSETISSEVLYYNGLKNGIAKYYDMMGILRLEYTYTFDVDNGKTTRFYVDGSKMYEYESISDTKHGDMIYYNMQGKVIALVGYSFGYPLYYKVLDNNEQLGEKVEVKPNSDFKIESKYMNGKKAFEINFKSGYWDGPMEIYGMDGKQQQFSNFKDDKLHNVRKEYYPSGTLYKSENFINGDFDGLQEYYDKDGQLLMSVMFKDDEEHGDLKLYKNGKLQKTKKYDTNILYEIINH
ncbi:MAG: hypothetical protein IPN86_12125 [Saprospiraceae bacterium]|nr:hypothetical protein [Saprospiraceae bacterium]